MKENPPKAVLFMPYTANSVLAGEIKETVPSSKPWIGLNMKIVEHAGNKLQDILLSPTHGITLTAKGRVALCVKLFTTKFEDCNFKNCHQRSVLYEMWCETCRKRSSNKNKKGERQEKKIMAGKDIEKMIMKMR